MNPNKPYADKAAEEWVKQNWMEGLRTAFIAGSDWKSSQSGKDDMTAKEFYAALDGILTFDFLNPEEQQTIFDFAELYAKGKLRQSGKERAALEKALIALMEAEAGLEFAGADKKIKKGHFIPSPTLSLIAVRKAITEARQALSTGVGEQDELKAALEECDRLAELVKFWQGKYHEVNPGWQPPKIDNL